MIYSRQSSIDEQPLYSPLFLKYKNSVSQSCDNLIKINLNKKNKSLNPPFFGGSCDNFLNLSKKKINQNFNYKTYHGNTDFYDYNPSDTGDMSDISSTSSTTSSSSIHMSDTSSSSSSSSIIFNLNRKKLKCRSMTSVSYNQSIFSKKIIRNNHLQSSKSLHYFSKNRTVPHSRDISPTSSPGQSRCITPNQFSSKRFIKSYQQQHQQYQQQQQQKSFNDIKTTTTAMPSGLLTTNCCTTNVSLVRFSSF